MNIIKREKDGIVYIDNNKCTYCKRCVVACPYGAPQKDEANKTISKCDFCKDRIDKNKTPYCISNCLSGALRMGTLKEINNNLKREVNGFSSPDLTSPSILFKLTYFGE